MNADLKRILPWLLVPLAIAVAAFVAPDAFLGASLEGRRAPNFTRPIEAGEGTADLVRLDALRGRVVVLDFWASWCGPCRRSIPMLNQIRSRVPGEVAFYGVNVERESALPPRALVLAHASFGAEFPTVRDPDGSIQAAYGVTRYPTVVVIRPDGTVHSVRGSVPEPSVLVDDITDALRHH